MKNITHDDITEALERFLARGGKIEKIKFKDNGLLLNNDLLVDQNFESDPSVLDDLQFNSIFESEVVN